MLDEILGGNTGVLIATGAYGRKPNEAHWELGYDFKVARGPYFSIRDIPALKSEGYSEIQFYDLNQLDKPEFIRML
jgi:hypothetical protein